MSLTKSILTSLQDAPGGLGITQIQALLPDTPRRTLQRRLSELVEDKQVYIQGKARASRYFIVNVLTPSIAPIIDGVASPSARYSSEQIVWSLDSQEVLAYVEQSLTKRIPVGYQYEFLEDYIPNQSFYLPASMRSQLRHLGTFSEKLDPAGTYNRAILNRLLIDLSWASSHLEGNTYSRLDTLKLLEQGEAASGKELFETQMILNHKNAIEFLAENNQNTGFNFYTLMNLHALLAENLLPNAEDEGRIRQHSVDIYLSVYRPVDNSQQLESFLNEILSKANQIKDPFEQSFFMMVHLPYLQPFADINKRTSRLAANIPLFKQGVCPLTFLGVPKEAYIKALLGLYEMTRIEPMRDIYLWAYKRSAQEYQSIRQTLVEPDALRLKWRDLIKSTLRQVVLSPEADGLGVINKEVLKKVPEEEQEDTKAIIIAELRRLHEGTLVRYGLRPSEFYAWRKFTNRQ